MLPYYMGEPPTLTFWRERILKRSMNFTFSGRVHEAIELRGKIVYADIPVVHDKLKSGEMGRNLHIYELMQSEGHAFTGRDAFYYGSELYYNGMSCKAAIMLKSFIDGIGTPADKGQASLYLSRCVKSEQRKECLLNGLSYAFAPDLCCELGDYFISVGELGNAKNCFLSALVADEKITFPSPDCLRLIPYLRLCYCYWHLGDKNKSKHYNDLAVELAPSDKRVLYNFALFGN